MALGRVADTSWLYAIFDDKDPHHDKARAWVLEPRVTLVPTAIMHETLDLIAYRHRPESARRAYQDMLSFPHFDMDYPVDEQTAHAIWLREPALSHHDAAVIACAEATGFDIATFDRRQAAAKT